MIGRLAGTAPADAEVAIVCAIATSATEQQPALETPAALPPGLLLQVLENERPVPAATYGNWAASASQAAHRMELPQRVMAVPVRVQADSRSEAAAWSSQSPVLVPTEEGAFWHATVQQLVARDAIAALARELALQSQLVARDTDQWLLRVDRESLNQAASRERLAAALRTNGHPVQLAVEIGRVSDSPARRNAAAAAEKMLVAERIIFEDPFVQELMRDFGAKIVPGSIKPA